MRLATQAAHAGHWVELRVTLHRSDLGGGGCGGGADVVISPGASDAAGGEPIVFNLVEVAKEKFDFALSPWMEESDL